ncbi:hypothetical protein BKA62DRAFT_496395 [Auriculariales sp. MPI-PUGE-AT-0066]|nr:hypothetical protein BKA62DRAFT_790161 [Auriculariales sp. MPI-PUGE-AT-0066]KAH7104167.1 hypothetical protein BKA62DRAFT_496395 [Auriculariales sp. MPI-PUGE-AT-0066]
MSSRFSAPSGLQHRDRGHLYASTPPASGRSSPFATPQREHTPTGQQRVFDDLEGQNDEHLDGLTAKVKILKDITKGIGSEIRDSTVQLTQMNDAFSETGDILSGTFRRLNNMAARQGCRWLWYIVFMMFILWFFVVVWWFRNWFRRS